MTQINNDDEKNKLSIDSLRKTITSAEKTIQSAKAMLLQLEGKKRVGRKRKTDTDDDGAIYGTFDGQIMIGDDGKQYPVPANYASKSKLVEGDMLKLVIDNGIFLYKQVGPIERKNLIGIAGQDEAGNYFVIADGTPYKILLASITYFKIEPGDEVVITIPTKEKSVWAAIENVLQKNDSDDVFKKPNLDEKSDKIIDTKIIDEENTDISDDEITTDEKNTKDYSKPLIDDWMSDIEEIKKEIKEERTLAN